MKNKAKLAFEMLEQEIEMMSSGELENFIGGSGITTDDGIMIDIDQYGNPMVSFDGGYTYSNAGGNFNYYFGSSNLQEDGEGQSYYQDNSGRVHYLMDTGVLWDSVTDLGSSLTGITGSLLDYFKNFDYKNAAGNFGYGFAIGIEWQILKEWWDEFGDKEYYIGSDGQPHRVY